MQNDSLLWCGANSDDFRWFEIGIFLLFDRDLSNGRFSQKGSIGIRQERNRRMTATPRHPDIIRAEIAANAEPSGFV